MTDNRRRTDATYECTVCHRGFTQLDAFDRHQTMADDARRTVTCTDPADLGMEYVEQVPGRSEGWRFPPSSDQQERLGGFDG